MGELSTSQKSRLSKKVITYNNNNKKKKKKKNKNNNLILILRAFHEMIKRPLDNIYLQYIHTQ